MKAILEFNLPDEQDEFNTHMKAYTYRMALSDFYNTSIRPRIKYAELSDVEHRLISAIADEFRAAVADCGDL